MKNSKFHGKRNFKPKQKEQTRDSRTEVDKKCTKDNDPSWYLVNGQLAKDVANFSYNNALGDGVAVTPGRVYDSSVTWGSTTFRLPGIATVLTGPSVGPSLDATAPVNVAARNIYSFVRHANSGHANYDPADLMIYLLAVDSVQSYWSWMVRIYGVMQTFSQRNRYIGDMLLRAMGVDPNIRGSICELRSYINQFAIKASVLAVPNTMSYFMRHAWMYQNVYADEDNPKAQLFLYAPAYLYVYSIDGTTQVGRLNPTPVAVNLYASGIIRSGLASRTLTEIKNTGDALINAMLAQEDVGIMSGDILKAYGSDKLYRFNQIAEDYAIAPVYSEEVLGQFHNLDMVGLVPVKATTDGYVPDFTESLSITQDVSVGSGILMFQPTFASALDLNYTHFLDTWKNDVTPEDSLVNSRLMMWANVISDSYKPTTSSTLSVPVVRLSSTGSEIVFDVVVTALNSAGTPIAFNCRSAYNASDPQQYNTLVFPYSTKFNEFPLMRQFSSQGVMLSVMGEMSNYTTLNESELSALHTTALLSMFGVPYNW